MRQGKSYRLGIVKKNKVANCIAMKPLVLELFPIKLLLFILLIAHKLNSYIKVENMQKRLANNAVCGIIMKEGEQQPFFSGVKKH